MWSLFRLNGMWPKRRQRLDNRFRWGWVFLNKQFQTNKCRFPVECSFPRHSIEFVDVETKPIVVSNVKMILQRQTYCQRSCISAGSKRRVLAFYFPVWIWCMFWKSKCRGESDLGLYTTLGLAEGKLLRNADFRQILRPNTFSKLIRDLLINLGPA